MIRYALVAGLCAPLASCVHALAAADGPLAEASSSLQNTRPMVVIDERNVMREEAPPHGAIGMSTAYRISDAAPGRSMEFRKRVLHPGAAIGAHVIAHDEVYYVLDGEGDVISDGAVTRLRAGMAAYLYAGANVGIAQVGEAPLTLIISYPLPAVGGH